MTRDERTTEGGRQQPSRRAVLIGAAATGAGAAAGSVLLGDGAASAATSPHTEPVVAHVRDVASGHIDIYVGERHVVLRDKDIAARLSNAAH